MRKLSFTQKVLKPWYTAFLVSIIYTLVGGLWVFFSEPVLSKLIDDPETFRNAKILSQWLFIVISAQLLFLLIRHRELLSLRSEVALHRVNRALRVFSECKKATTWHHDENELLRKICRILVVLGGYRLAWVAYPSDDEEKSVKVVAHWGYEDDYLKSMKASWDESAYGQGPAGTTLRTGQTVIVRDIMSNPMFAPWRESARDHGFASAISLPMHNGKKVSGALVIFAAEVDSFDLEETSQLEELADDLANHIQVIHSENEQKLIKEEQLFLAKVLHQASDGVLTYDRDTRVQYLNPAWERICGVVAKDVVGYTLHELACARRNEDFYLAVQRVVESGELITGQYLNKREDGSTYQIEAQVSPVFIEHSETVHYVAVIRDVTYEVELEDQLRTAQKMEAIATLAGGIAHDFNNILAAILTNTELALDDLPEGSSLRDHLEIVYQAGGRGKSLVKQILTISRQNNPERKPVLVEVIVKECLELLRASLPSTIEIRQKISRNLGQVDADPTQLHQVILNICTNAADAMKDQGGGVLELTLEEHTVHSHYNNIQAGLNPGRYLKLSIKDSGHGMDRETLEQVFNPFFTTKGMGKGTGLGMSVAHSIIKSHGGLLNVESVPGQGSMFYLYLPKIYSVDERPAVNDRLLVSKAHEKILFVDDEPALVFAGKTMLEKLGYDVVASTDSRMALQLFMEKPASFDLVITDQTMPHLTGEMLAREVFNVRSELPIILCSGNDPSNAEFSVTKARNSGIQEFMTKPYERSEMSQAIRRVLD